MKNVIRLTERDLSRIVRRIVNEAQTGFVVQVPTQLSQEYVKNSKQTSGTWVVENDRIVLTYPQGQKTYILISSLPATVE